MLARVAIASTAVLAFALGLGVVPQSVSAGVLYGSSRTCDIFTIDTTTGAGTLVGNLGVGQGCTEIEHDNTTGTSWQQGVNGTFVASEFDIFTATSLGGPISNGASFTGLEFIGSTLYGTAITGPGGLSTLRTLDPTTGVSVTIGLTGVGPIAGLAFDAAYDVMYGITGGTGPADLLTIDLLTGMATLVGTTDMQAGSLQFGMDGLLYAGGTGASGGLLFSIATMTGLSTLIGATGFDRVTGLTLVGVVDIPEPSTLALFVIALAGLGFMARRRVGRA